MKIIHTFQDASTWDVQGDTGFLTFATPEDAKKAEELFNRVQTEAWNAAIEKAARACYDTPTTLCQNGDFMSERCAKAVLALKRQG